MEYKVVSTGTEWRTPPRVCRCCLSEGCYKDISSEYYWMGEKETYAEMLKECFDLTISLEDVGNTNSRLICEVCITRLRDASNFKKQVVNSEKRFAEHMRTGTGLSAQQETAEAAYAEVKIEGVKDETVISDDDPGPEDDIYDDPDYDESDSLPLKYEVQKKEALGDISFGDEIPTLSNPEMTIRRVSKSKEKPAKKMKLNKKELTIKPVKASGSKAKSAKAAKAAKAAKEPKAAKKGRARDMKGSKLLMITDGDIPLVDFDITSLGEVKFEDISEEVQPKSGRYQRSAKALAREAMKRNASTILQSSDVTPFRWWRNCFLCSYCDEKFMDTKELKVHTADSHADASITVIYKKFKEIGPINVDITQSKCRMCDFLIDDMELFKEHLLREHEKILQKGQDGILPFSLNKDAWRCLRCDVIFNNFLKLYEHMNCHYQNYICDTCGKGFMTAPRLRKHNESHNVGSFPCNRCDQVFSLRAARDHHKIRFHTKGPRYECPHCLLRFTNYYERMRHLSVEHNVKVVEYKCFHCELSFETSGKRSIHVRTVHLPQEKKFSCQHCPWQFVTQYELKRHMVRHTGERVFNCNVCQKSYPRIKTLREHMRGHTNDRRFVCAVCGQAFLQKCSWKQHVRAHHPERAQQMTDNTRRLDMTEVSKMFKMGVARN